METLPISTGPTRMYAMMLKLRPLQAGTLMPFNGELVHAAFLNWLRASAPDVATWLHEGQKRRLFTCSSLHFSRPMQAQQRPERENIHLPLDPYKTYTIRLTLLLGELFPLFYKALTRFNQVQEGTAPPPFIQLGKQLFLLEGVLLEENDPSGWTGFTSPLALVEDARKMSFNNRSSLTLEFASLTTFNRGNKNGYGTHPAMLPLPLFVYQNLMKRWEDIAPPELASVIQKELLEQYLKDDGVIIIDYDLKAHHVHFNTHQQRGFLGTCTYQIRLADDKQASPDTSLTLQQQIFLLSRLAFYTGVGYKTAMGLGQARLRP